MGKRYCVYQRLQITIYDRKHLFLHARGSKGGLKLTRFNSLLSAKVKERMCEGFNDWGGRGYDDFVPGEITKIVLSGDETTLSSTWSASLPRIHRI